VSNSNPNRPTNLKTLTTLAQTDSHGAFESFCARYFVTLYGTIPAPSTVQ